MSAPKHEMSEQEAIQKYQHMKRECQIIMQKLTELEYELGEHELVVSTISKLPVERAAFRLVGTVLIRETVSEVLPRVSENKENIASTIDKLRTALKEKNVKVAEWKAKYNIKTQQEVEMEQRTRAAQQEHVGVLA